MLVQAAVTKINVLIVAPNELVRESLRCILDSDDLISVSAVAADPISLTGALSAGSPDVIVIDHDTPMWIDVVDAATARRSATPLLLLTTFMDEGEGCVSLDGGQMRVMAKGASPEALFSAVYDLAGVDQPSSEKDEDIPSRAATFDVEAEAGDSLKSSRHRWMSTGLHIGAIAVLAAVFAPLAQWYYAVFPPIGFDFFHFVYYVNYLRENMGLFTGMWKFTWYAGAPFSREYPFLHMYATVPLSQFFGDTVASQVYLLGALFAFAIVCYFLYFSLSRQRFLSLALAGITLWSPSVLNALVRDGWASFAASQVFFALSLLLLVKYFQRGSPKFAVAAAAVCGIAFGGHAAMGALSSMFSYGILILGQFCWPSRQRAGGLGVLALYPLVATGVGAAFAFPFLSSNYAAVAFQTRLSTQVIETFPNALAGLFTSSNPLLFVPLTFLLGLVVHSWRRGFGWRRLGPAWAFIGMLLFLTLLLYGYEIGRNPMQALGGPNRAWWIGTILLSCLAAALAKDARSNVARFGCGFLKRPAVVLLPASLLLVGLTAATPRVAFDDVKQMVMQTIAPTENTKQVLLRLGLDEDKKQRLAADVPDGVDLQSTDQRVWISDPTFALIWNLLFPMPSTKGYFYQALFPSWDYWRDVAIGDGLAKNEGVPADIAKNNALFHIDWYAIKYLTDIDHVASYLTESLPTLAKAGGFSFLEVKNASHIIEPTNARAIMVIGDGNGYDVVLRAFAARNLSSQRFILLRGPETVDDVDQSTLSDLDGLILYNHRYRDRKKALEALRGFVEQGGSLMVETGSESADTQAEGLPDPFPVSLLEKRLVQGRWSLGVGPGPIQLKANWADFSPPSYDGNPWGISAAPSDKLVKAWAQTVLREDGRPVIAAGTFGKGRVVWAGLNLPYHLLSYRNSTEAEAFENVVNWAFQKNVGPIAGATIDRPRPEKVTVNGEGFLGVLFREYYYSGWSAEARNGDRTVSRPIYRAGPDFMYVRIPSGWQGPSTVSLSFGGPPNDWAALLVSLLSLILVLEYLLFSGRLLLRPICRLVEGSIGRGFAKLAERSSREDEE